MQGTIWPQPLIVQANELADRNGTRGTVRMVDLRRAVSNAYYALFHTTSVCTVEWLLPNAPKDEQLAVVRRFSHRAFRAVFERINSPKANKSSPHLQPTLDALHGNADILVLAQTFVDLHDARNKADYDHTAEFTRQEVLTLIDRSWLAVQTITKSPKKQADVDCERLFACLAMTPGAQGR
jgi:hypothetical protein